MPEKDGWQVIQELKSNPETRDIPVIMCSIVADQDHGVSLGASDYLIKPIMEQELIAALERLDRKDQDHHRVLIVDDQSEDRSLLRRMIESQDGYEVMEAAGGQEAIDLVEKVRPSIIILDLMMPDVNGFAVLESVKANKATRSIPIIVVTAKTLTQEERNVLNKGVQSLLQKGLFGQEELLADVSAALNWIAVNDVDG
jgi:CheY-like chemotaxis protein